MPATARTDTLTELERLALALRRLDGGLLAERLPRTGVGGTELSGYRDYAPGDDRRHIDWNVCARHDELPGSVLDGDLRPRTSHVAHRGHASFQRFARVCRRVQRLFFNEGEHIPEMDILLPGAGVPVE